MPELPTGTVTFLFTDVEGSTRLLAELGDRRRWRSTVASSGRQLPPTADLGLHRLKDLAEPVRL
jgi:hypothetical protein